jgi:hypothetical protein
MPLLKSRSEARDRYRLRETVGPRINEKEHVSLIIIFTLEDIQADRGPSLCSGLETEADRGPSLCSGFETEADMGPSLYSGLETEADRGPSLYSGLETRIC